MHVLDVSVKIDTNKVNLIDNAAKVKRFVDRGDFNFPIKDLSDKRVHKNGHNHISNIVEKIIKLVVLDRDIEHNLVRKKEPVKIPDDPLLLVIKKLPCSVTNNKVGKVQEREQGVNEESDHDFIDEDKEDNKEDRDCSSGDKATRVDIDLFSL